MIQYLIPALVMGLASSLHCAGMCGPIIWLMPFQQMQGWRRMAGILTYHLSRVSIYALMGVGVYSLRHLFNPHWQRQVAVASGLLLLVMGLLSLLARNPRMPWSGWVQQRLSGVLGRKSIGWLAAAGALNGLLPCGMVYMALALAISAPTMGAAAGVMYFFGFGTMPMLIALTLLKGRLRLGGGWLKRWAPVAVMVLGSLFILRGAGLGIPFLSPLLSTSKDEIHSVRSSCCHAPEEGTTHAAAPASETP